MWPLIAACSVYVRNPEDDNRPEYIIPQQLIRYIYENNIEIDGIRYLSTKYTKDSKRKCEVKMGSDYARENINFVFLARMGINEEEYSSELARKLKISEMQCVSDVDLK